MVIPCKKKKVMSNYTQPHFTIEPKELGSEILIAELGKPLESFTETETGISCAKGIVDEKILETYKFCNQ
jgi:ribosomal protein L11 methyltransferase